MHFVARLLARSGAVAVAEAISPYVAARDEVRAGAARDDVPFVEVYVCASIERLAERDVRGDLAQSARGGASPPLSASGEGVGGQA